MNFFHNLNAIIITIMEGLNKQTFGESILYRHNVLGMLKFSLTGHEQYFLLVEQK